MPIIGKLVTARPGRCRKHPLITITSFSAISHGP